MDDKIIVSNRTALVAKYAVCGWQKIYEGRSDLIAADSSAESRLGSSISTMPAR